MECCRLRIKDIEFSRNELIFAQARATKTATRCCRQRSKKHSSNISRRIEASIRKISRKGSVGLLCRMHWNENIRTLDESGHGNGFSQLLNPTPIELPVKSAATIYTSRFCNELSVTRSSRQESPNQPVAILFVTASRLTC